MEHNWGMKMLSMMVAILALSSANAMAAADCKKYPKSEWMKEEDLKARLQEQGYKIKKFKVAGDCYEIYGWDKEGRKVEIYFDAKDGTPVKTKVF